MLARQWRPATIMRIFPRVSTPRLSAGTPGPAATVTAQRAGEASDPVVSYLTDLLASTRDELNRADSKAALLLAAVGVIIGALVGCFTSSHWTPMSLGVGEQALWWVGVAAATVGVFLVSASVYPRGRQHGTPYPGLPAYYRDVAALPDIAAFRLAVGKAPDVTERLLDQAYTVAGIVQAKYVQLQRGLVCFLIAIVACILSVVFQVILG